ncbi:MAG TPA: 4Fe-4S dicluster domain-containing protein [bacterium]|nr:4Fe-4S dicluster domain-containing protein [bacterium]
MEWARFFLPIISRILLGSVAAAGFLFTACSLFEKRVRPALRSLLLSMLWLTGYWLFLSARHIPLWVDALIPGFAMMLLILVLIRIPPPVMKRPGPESRIDERDALFHRFYRLEPGSREYKIFYRTHPDLEYVDNAIRNLPNLGEPGSRSWHPLSSLYPLSIFDVLEDLTRGADGDDPDPVSRESRLFTPEEYTRRVKGMARYLGADSVGAAPLNPAYVYSHIGRSPGPWGKAVTLDHSNAIVIAVEMKHEMIRYAPDVAVTTESACRYFDAAKAALVIARILKRWGFRARAHVDANYRVLCVPVAVDAGLGELGRLGLLITPQFGPRVRLAVVTTDMPLIHDAPVHFGVQDFCRICMKCAVNCPSGAISREEKINIRGIEKWQSVQESCYRFWRRQGSDCSLCVRVCPYSHPASPIHNVIRRVTARNPWNRRAALLGDDFFYGRRPARSLKLPEWHRRDIITDETVFKNKE